MVHDVVGELGGAQHADRCRPARLAFARLLVAGRSPTARARRSSRAACTRPTRRTACLVGDPSTAKSQFLTYICSILPRAVYAI